MFTRRRHQLTDRIIGAHQVVGEMRVQTLHSPTRATDSSAGRHEVTAHDGRVATSRVVVVRSLQFTIVNELFEAVHPAIALEGAHRGMNLRIHQPVQGGHRCAVSQVRLVFDHHGPTVSSSYDHGESTAEWPADEIFYELLIVRRGVAKGQRQNSKVCAKRERNPFER